MRLALALLLPFWTAWSQPRWVETAPMPLPRSEIRAAVIDDKFYVVGGFDNRLSATGDLQAYDPAADSWQVLAPAPIGMDHQMVVAHGGLLYVLKYAAIHVYNPATDAWSTRAEGGQRREDGTAVVIGDHIYALGGAQNRPMQRYHVADRAWEDLAMLPAHRGHVNAVVLDGEIWMLAGRDATQAYRTVHIYNPGTDSWRAGPPMDSIRSGHGAEAVAGRIVVAGGEIPGTPRWRVALTTEMYDPASGGWTFLPDTPEPIHGVASVSWRGRMYLLGGSTVAQAAVTSARCHYIDIAAATAGISPGRGAGAFPPPRSRAGWRPWQDGLRNILGRAPRRHSGEIRYIVPHGNTQQ